MNGTPDEIPGEPGAPTYPPRHFGWGAVAVLSGLCLLSMLDRNVLVLLVDEVSKDLGITDVQVSLLYGGAFSLFYALGALPIGWALDRFPRRRVIFACVALWSAATIACGLARTYTTMLMARAGVGAGEAVLTPGANSILSDMFPPSRMSLPIGVYMASAKAGQSLSLIIGAGLAALVAPGATFLFSGIAVRGWQLIFFLVGAPGLILAFAIFLIPEPGRRHAEVARDTGYGAFLRYVADHKRLFGSAYIGSMLYLALTTAVVSWSPAVLQRVYGISVQQSGFLLGAAFLIAAVAGAPLHGWIVDRQMASGRIDAHLRHLIWMGILSLPAGIAGYLVPNVLAAVFLMALFMFMIAGFGSLPSAAVLLFTPPPLRGKAMSVMFLVNAVIGISMGPALVALLSEKVFGDRTMIGAAVSIEIALFVPLASLAFALTLKPLRARLIALNIASAG